MNFKSKLLLAGLGGVVLFAGTWTQAQDSAAAAVAAPTNLRVLPAHSSRASVRSLMKQYERELGVSCSYCHVEDRDSGVIDYASDENPRKHTARIMISMLNDINEKHLAQLGGDRRYAQPVTCASCHQGRASPPVFER
jgi:mono/diheme cytochrome c family protein